jgi:large subunit ribosomal protein L18
MNREKRLQKQRQRRAWRVRNSVRGDAARPRLCIYRSHRHIYAQLIDDERGVTLCSASTRISPTGSAAANTGETGSSYGGTVEDAQNVGVAIAGKAIEQNIKKICFDRGPYKYHGRVRALADAARENGLEF